MSRLQEGHAVTIRDAVIACVRMGMDWRTVALAYKLTDAQVIDIWNEETDKFLSVRCLRRPRSKSRGAR